MNLDSRRRRDFLRVAAKTAGVAGALTVLPESIQKALAIPAASSTGTLQDVEHVVIFMQENRSFDHYYGTMRGVRGFGDRITTPLPGGKSVWQQQSRKTGKEVLPFHLDTATTRAQCVSSLDHGWPSGHKAWNRGKYDDWVDAKSALTMGYYKEADIPFQFALANAFTICDAYFCSVMGPTDPNRIYHWTGSINPPGNQAGALIDNDIAEKYVPSWITCPERLEKAGISWRVYQKGLDYDSKRPFDGNYGDNPLVYFKQYLHSAQDSKLRREALSPHPLSELARDVASGQLPQVSWIVAPEAFSEHPAWPPAYGAQYTAEVLDALTGNPKVWSKTVLFINYDENDGYFDHVVPPTPPISRDRGHSTVDASDEIYDDPKLGPTPYGLGVRVPMVVVSPWTRGGWVCSEVFDHTSVLRFLEARLARPCARQTLPPGVAPSAATLRRRSIFLNLAIRCRACPIPAGTAAKLIKPAALCRIRLFPPSRRSLYRNRGRAWPGQYPTGSTLARASSLPITGSGSTLQTMVKPAPCSIASQWRTSTAPGHTQWNRVRSFPIRGG